MGAKIIFANGLEINAEVNGNNFIVDKKPSFPVNLKNIKIESSDGTTVITNGMITTCAPLDKRYWFTISEVPTGTLQMELTDQRIADIEDALCEMSKD